MPTTNQHWYVENQTRAYPLADTVQVEVIPPNLLCDLRLFVTEQAPDVQFFIYSIVHTPTWLTFTIAKRTGSSEYVLAVFSQKTQQLEPYRVYPLDVISPDDCLSGFVVFGSGLQTLNRLIVQPGAENGLLAVSTLMPGFEPPIKSIGVDGLDRVSLTGAINLVVESPMTYRIDKQEKVTYVILELEQKPEVLQAYAGRCGRRLQNGDCVVPPIETIASVLPDCDGQITIELVGCATVSYTELLNPENPENFAMGAVIECSTEIDDICSPGTIDPAGNLNSDQNECET